MWTRAWQKKPSENIYFECVDGYGHDTHFIFGDEVDI
jgi:hypothetical protein